MRGGAVLGQIAGVMGKAELDPPSELSAAPHDPPAVRRGAGCLDEQRRSRHRPRYIGSGQTLVLEFAGDVQEIAETKKHRLLWRLTGTLITGQVAPCVVIDDKSWWKTKADNGS